MNILAVDGTDSGWGPAAIIITMVFSRRSRTAPPNRLLDPPVVVHVNVPAQASP